jgi:hypothetical protein
MRTHKAIILAVSSFFLSAPAMSAMAAGHVATGGWRPAPPRAVVSVAVHAPTHSFSSRTVTRQGAPGRVRVDSRQWRGNRPVFINSTAVSYWGDDSADNSDPSELVATSIAPTDDSSDNISCPTDADLQALADSARAEMGQVQGRVEANLNASPQWIQINADLMKALTDLDSARGRVEQSLRTSPDYQDALAKKQEARGLADAMHAQGNPSMAEMTPIAQRGLEAASAVTRIESTALAKDRAWNAARTRLLAIATERDILAKQVPALVQNDPVWQAAKHQLNSLG